jgi:hypothetical protein
VQLDTKLEGAHARIVQAVQGELSGGGWHYVQVGGLTDEVVDMTSRLNVKLAVASGLDLSEDFIEQPLQL